MTSERRSNSSPDFSIVIPMLNEADTVTGLLSDCIEACKPLGSFEICVTNDGSTDATETALTDFAKTSKVPITVVSHPNPAGQSAAVHAAVSVANAEIIATLDGDGQNPPSELPKVLRPLLADTSVGLVAGQRIKRDDPMAKRLASRAANAIRRSILRDATRDTGCGLKAFRKDAFLALPYFNHMHRYLPALFARDGWPVAHADVAHQPRLAGTSKYSNLGRAIVGIYDLIGVAWLIRRRRKVRMAEAKVVSYSGQD